ncbi:MAG: hypothetical protein ABI763_15300 [Bacteroidota bacterium]
MKNKIYSIALAFTIMFAGACKKEDSSPSGSGVLSMSETITSGTWRVSFFHEDNADHTSDFNGYTFAFNSSGTMAAIHSSGTTSGTWHIDDSEAHEFHMSIGSIEPLTCLDRSWRVTSNTGSEVQLGDDSGSSDRALHFTKL